MPRLPAAKVLAIEESVRLEFGGVLDGLEIAYETWGELAPDRSNVILLCPAFSAHSHAASSSADPTRGWWENVVGPGLGIDTEQYFCICPSLVGTNYGSTGPVSPHPDDGKPWALRFPVITTKDLAALHGRLLDHLGIDQVHGMIGGSFGALQVMEFLVQYPARVEKAFAISGTDYTRPYTAAIRHVGRRAITLDPDFKAGDYGDEPPTEGLRLAREIGTLYYRSREEFNRRFDHAPIRPPAHGEIVFDVQSYLDHQGKKAPGQFDPNCYLVMSLAMDLHDIGRGHENVMEAYRPVETEVLVVGVNEDRLIPLDEQQASYDVLREAGCRVRWHMIHSDIGHDAFLADTDTMNEMLRAFL